MRASSGGQGDHDPGARALAAMAEAAERSRLAATDAGRPPSPGRSRRWPTAVLLASVVVVVVAAVAVGVTTRHPGGTPVASSHPAPGPVPAPHSSPATGSHAAPTPPVEAAPATVPTTTVPTTTAPSTTVPPPAGAPAASPPPTTGPTPEPGSSQGPELSSLVPSTGAAGQVLVINGANFVSASGQITAAFGGENTLIACPTSTSCLIQVPAPTGNSNPVPVTVTTDGGTSNAVSFTYG
jgi:hypothetical protein